MIATASQIRSTSSSWWLEKTTGTPVAAYSLSTPLEHVDADRVEAGERLVEHQQLGLVDERGRELDALLVAERELLDAVLGALGQARGARSSGPRRASGRVDAVQRGEVDELGAHAHLRVQAALLRHVAEARAGARRRRGAPRQRTSPRSAPRTPRMIRIVVVLPAPLGPTKPNV